MFLRHKTRQIVPFLILRLERILTDYSFVIKFKFCTKNSKKSKEDDDILVTNKIQKQTKIEDVKKEMNISKPTFSFIPEYLKITRPWILGLFVLFASLYVLKKLFIITEVMIDPLSGQKKRQLFGLFAGIHYILFQFFILFLLPLS